jgi:hypothetical protein
VDVAADCRQPRRIDGCYPVGTAITIDRHFKG